MTTELAMAVAIIVLGLVQLVLAALEFRRVHGVHYANTAMDKAPEKPDSPLLGRLSRAQRNLMETAPYFIGICLIIAVTGTSSVATQVSAVIFVAARIVYFPLYALGVPYLRGMVWMVSFAALCAMTAAVAATIDWVAMVQPTIDWMKALQGG
jgi:uncharacterized MAPEG superfamily protein